MAVVMARLISISLLILLSMMFLTEQATAQKDCLCWVNAKTGKPAADAPGGNSEVDLTDPDHAFQPSTGDNFYRDKATCRWINSKTGRPAADVPAGHSERDLLDPTRAFQPSTGDNFYRIIPCPVKTTAAFTPPSGETVQGERGNFFAEAGGAQFRETWTGTNIHIGVYFKNANEWKLYEGAYRSPTDVQIVNVLPITGDTMAYELIALSNGNVVNTSGYKLGTVPLGLYESPKKLIGDALYMLTTQNIFVSRDTAKTWTIDTIGLGGTPQDIAIDSQQFVYAIPRNGSNNGLFRQHPDTNIWRVITTLPAKANPNKIFIDRRNRIYLGVNKNGYRLLYRSVDRGASWQIDTVGISRTLSVSVMMCMEMFTPLLII